MIRKLIGILPFILCACSHREYSERTVYFHAGPDGKISYLASDMTEQEIVQLPTIAARMNKFLDCPDLIQFVSVQSLNKNSLPLSVEEDWGIYNPEDQGITILIGGVEKCVDDGQTFDACFQALMLHELGHSFGLGHTDVPAIMFPHMESAFDFTKADFEERDKSFYHSITIKKD